MTEQEHVPADVTEALADLRRRTRLMPLPGDDFDWQKSLKSTLVDFGLPDPDEFPAGSAGYLARRAFLTGPFRFVDALTGAAPDPALLRSRISAFPPPPWPAQKSSNWSGGYVAPRDGRSITTVTGKWTVPTVTAPAGGTESEYHSSTWIGLDGQRAYRDSTLPQIGTSQILNTTTGAVTYKAWYQWWARGQNAPPQDISMAVNPGNEISATITVLSPTRVRFNIKNVTLSEVPGAIEVDAPQGHVISGATAEWIMERPSELGYDGWNPYPLPVYTDFSFTGCVAGSVEPGSMTLSSIDLELARLIRMYEIVPNPPAVRTISVASKTLLPTQSLDLTYVGP
jgi:hypothetical protein